MQLKEFLALVVPWDVSGGYIRIEWHRPVNNKWTGRACQTVDAALQVLASIANNEYNVFFCLSAQSDPGHRYTKNALGLTAIWVDADVKDDENHYHTVDEAIAAILAFCEQLGIPYPSIIVRSGGGVHAYWLSDVTLPVEKWRPFANGLKAAALQAGLKIDTAVTIDAARILRVPDTTNYKYTPPQPCLLVNSQERCPGTKYNFDTQFAKLLELAPVPNVVRLRQAKPIKIAERFTQGGPMPSLAIGIDINEAPPIPLEPVMAACPLFKEAYETGGADETNFANPIWNLVNLATIFMVDGRRLAHLLGNKHPDYSEAETNAQFDRKQRENKEKGLGWPSCRAFHDAGATQCKTCPHLKLGKSPLNFGLDAARQTASEEEKEKEAADLGARDAPELRLPKGYKLNEHGQVCVVISSHEDGKKVTPGRLMALFYSRFRDISLRFRDGDFGLRFIVPTDKEGETEVFLSAKNCYEPPLFQELIGRMVRYQNGKEEREMIKKFTASWLDLLLTEDTAIHDQGLIGWHYQGDQRCGFAYGQFLYHENGENLPIVLNADDKEFNKHYSPQGKREPWLEAAKLLTNRKRPELDIIIAVAFAAPLATFAGTLYGVILSIWGDPGTAKSTAQMVAAAVWGHPKQTRESLTSTAKSIQGRLGRTRNLPAYWDDVQDERHQQALFDTMFVASEGAEGGRLNTDATYKKRLEWQTIMIACSNASFVGYLTNKQRSTTAGIRRVFEIVFRKRADETGMINPVKASKAFQELEHNYGVIGAEYAQLLARNHKMIDGLVSDIMNAFREKVEGTIEENYWWGVCGILLSGAVLATKLGVNLDVMAMEEFLVEAYRHNRKIRTDEGTESGTFEHMESSLGDYLNDFINAGNSLYTDILFKHREVKVEPLKQPGFNSPIHIQVVRDEDKILISKKAMREYFYEKEIQARSVFEDMKKHLGAREVKLTLGAGTAYAQAQEWIYLIENASKHKILYDIMTAWGESKSATI